MKDITERDYREYLINLIDTVFKILPLYEEKNEHLDEYMDSLLCFELYGVIEAIQNLPHQLWYVKTIATLEGVRKNLVNMDDSGLSVDESADNHRRIRREILKTTALIDKQIDQLRGE